MSGLYLSVLGPFSATLDQQPISQFRTHKVGAVLIYLGVEHDRPHQREALINLLWPELPLVSAQVNLQQTLYRLHQAIPAVSDRPSHGQVPLIITDHHTVQINPAADFYTDLDEFYRLAEIDPAKAVELVRADFLADFFLADSSQFEDWAGDIREKIRRKTILLLDGLTTNHLQAGRFTQAQQTAWRQLEIDRLRQSAYRQLMMALAQDGQRSAALSLYQTCRERLAEGLGVSPNPQTITLYEQIQSDALERRKTHIEPCEGSAQDCMPIFLLTDIEDSTRLWDTHHQAMLTALLQHNSILEKQIGRYGGRILELRGDGVKAVFEGGDPLACVIAIQIELGAADWGEIGELKIRIGLHGVPTVREGYDYFQEDEKYYGPVLNHTARIMDAGWGAQILVSQQVRNTCPLPEGASWQDFGAHKVKSLDHSIKILGLRHPSLPHQSFPPLRTVSKQEANPQEKPAQGTPHNLPEQATLFLGRQRELEELKTLLLQPTTRLVSIVGPGGMGKTRLALALAEMLLERDSRAEILPFKDGIYFVPLASLDESHQIIPAVAKALNIPIDSNQSSEGLEPTQTEETLVERLFGFLNDKEILIVLDNFEHLLGGADQVSNFLSSNPNLQIIVTSRERLHILEEQVFPIQGLEFPDGEVPQDPEQSTAMQLFIQSAKRILPTFKLKPADNKYLTRICSLVGGMPLGLELAATWVDMLATKDIAEEIQKSIDFLETDIRNIPDRHRSIRAVFDSSWNRLSTAEKRIFSRFSLLRGAFTRSAAQDIAGASIRNLASFVSKSLLHYNQHTERYQVHELLRQYGEEYLNHDADEAFHAREKHSAYYCKAVNRHMNTLMSGKTHLAYKRIGADIDNIRRAWNWAIGHNKIVYIHQALNGLCMYYSNEWGIENGLKLCDDVENMLSKNTSTLSPDSDTSLGKRLHVRELNWRGFFIFRYDPEQAKIVFSQSEHIIKQLFDAGVDMRTDKALLHFFSGFTLFSAGETGNAQKHVEASLAISQEIGDQWLVLNSLALLGDIASWSGSPRIARHWYEKYLAEARAVNNFSAEITAFQSMGWAARKLMAYDEARHYYEEGIKLAKSYKDPLEELNALQQLGFLCLLLGEFEQAIQLFSNAVAISTNLGVPQRTLAALVHIGFSYWILADFKRAETAFHNTLNQVKGKSEGSQLFATVCYAEYLIMLGQYQEGKVQLKIAKKISAHVFTGHFFKGRLVRNLGWLALAEKNFPEAKIHFEESIHLFKTDSDDEQVAWSQAGLARAEIGLGNWEAAKVVLMDALWTSIEMQAFIPLVFTLPITILYLAKQDIELARSMAGRVYSYPFLANSQFIQDIVNRYLPDKISGSPQVGINHQDDPKQPLWDAASGIMFNWMQTWMEQSVENPQFQSTHNNWK